MMKRLAVALFALFLSVPAMAQYGHPAIGYQQITSLASATNLTVPRALAR
jgi:hypothetical protein